MINTLSRLMIGSVLIALSFSAAAQVVVNMPPPPARSASGEARDATTASSTATETGLLALSRYVGAQVSPTITTAPASGPLAYAYGLSTRYRSIGWDGWHGGWYGGPGCWGWPIIVHPKHPIVPGHGHCPPDFFSGSFKYSGSKWNIRLRF